MRKKKIIAILLCFIMLFSSSTSAFAAEIENEPKSIIQSELPSQEEASEVAETEKQETADIATENIVTEEVQFQSVDDSVWAAEDFTYTDYEKLLYGCDYTRQITIKGKVISGFSESGEEKLAKNTDLVIPAEDTEGTPIVGVGEGAFSKKGLTSVEFPTGMIVDYDDTVTHQVTKRGNFVIAENAFSGNKLTSVTLPEGVIACLPSSFLSNQITTVKLPKTIWWIETQAFAKNRITTVNFPTSCDFQLEMHGLTFAWNFIESVRLPDYTEVVNKDVFAWNKGKEPIADDAKDSYKTYTIDGTTYDAGVVYMYTDNPDLANKDRIHHTGKLTDSQHSYVQKLVVNDGTGDTQNPELAWNVDDFTIEGTVIKGLSESGVIKRTTEKDLVLPDRNKNGEYITEIAAGQAGENGLFASETEGFDSVYLPSELKIIGNFAFQNSGLKEVTFPSRLTTIGISAFAQNNLTSVVLPDTVTSLGGGAFGTNPKLRSINLSKALTEIPDGAFGCSDAKNYMTDLTSITLHEGITKIGRNAFAGNNFKKIVIPATVKEIGQYAFSTKEYLSDSCELVLNEGLETIGNRAFRNKTIEEVTLPATVTKIDKNVFEKVYSSGESPVVTKVYVSLRSQYEDTKNFPKSDYHKLYLTDVSEWTAEDFTYAEQPFELYPADEMENKMPVNAWVITGFSEEGENKIGVNTELVIPETDPDGRKVQGVADYALQKKGITSLTLPNGVKAPYDDSTWNQTGKGVEERGDFFIGASAFLGNELTTLDLPDGVIYVGGNAFKNNRLTTVTFPTTIMMIASQSFAANNIVSLEFPGHTDFALQMDNMAFGQNKVKAVQLPDNTIKVTKWAFFQNTGMEPVTSGTSAEKIGGIVHMYKAKEGGAYIEHVDNGTSNVQKLIIGTIPEELAPWNESDFIFDDAGTTITGLSDTGKEKIKDNAALILPKTGPNGEAVTALGDGKAMAGIFTYTEDEKNYAPASVLLPNTLTKIGMFTFALNASVTYEAEMQTITLPEGLLEIAGTAFQNSKLTAISIPDSVTTMGNGTFTGSVSLTKVKLSKNVKDIPQAAFNAGAGKGMALETVVIPEGVETIGKSAFTGAHVENLTLPSTLTSIGDTAFQNHQMTTVDIPGNVVSIGKNAFSITEEGLSKKLTSITLHEGLETIGQEAFKGNAITEVELPNTVKLSAVNKAADCIFGSRSVPVSPIVIVKTSDMNKVETCNTEFANTNSHKVVYDKLVGTGWKAEDFTYDETAGIITGWSESGQAKRESMRNLVLPDTTPGGKDIVGIGNQAFKIPDEEIIVTKFGIESPNGMTSVVLPEKVTMIGAEAFSQNALTTIELSNMVAIGERAFYGNKLTKVELPDTVTDLGEGAFATNEITELKLSKGVTVIPQGAFSMNIRLEQVEIPDTVKVIGEMAFAGARLTSLTIPESVIRIERKAFHLHHLPTLVIPGNVKEIGESAFEGTYKATTLTTLVIEEGVESIGKYAFKEALLETVHFPNSIKEVGEQPFLNNKGKDGSHVVEVTTRNHEHEKLKDDTYTVKYILQDISGYKDAVKLSFTEAEYTGKAIEPEVSIEGLTEGTDYTVTYADNVEAEDGKVIITGSGDYSGTIVMTFKITAKAENPNPENPNPENPDPEKPGQGNQDQQNGSGTGNGNTTPKTGDTAPILPLAAAMIVSIGGMAFVFRKRRAVQ